MLHSSQAISVLCTNGVAAVYGPNGAAVKSQIRHIEALTSNPKPDHNPNHDNNTLEPRYVSNSGIYPYVTLTPVTTVTL